MLPLSGLTDMHEGSVAFGIAVIAAIAVGYVLSLRLISIWAFPKREALFALGNEILNDPRSDQATLDFVSHGLRYAMAYRGAFVWTVMAFVYIVSELIKLLGGRGIPSPKHQPALRNKTAEFSRLFLISNFAANPIFGSLAYLLTWAARFIARLNNGIRTNQIQTDLAIFMANHPVIQD